MCKIFYIGEKKNGIDQLFDSTQCSWRSFTVIVSLSKCGFNEAYFPVVDILTMLIAGMLCDVAAKLI